MSTSPRADLDRLIRDTAPVRDEEVARADLSAGYAELRDNLVRRARAEAGVLRRRYRRRAALVVAAAVTAFAATTPTGAAAAGWLSAHTGLFGSPGATENGTREFLDLGGRDFPRIARELAAGISYPPGDDVDNYIAVLQADARETSATGKGRDLMEDAGVRVTLHADAVCAWSGYWLDAHSVGAAARDAAAVRGLTHPQPDPAYQGPGDAAQASDPAVVQQFWTANCTGLPQRWKNR
jgi:hypothetical protein